MAGAVDRLKAVTRPTVAGVQLVSSAMGDKAQVWTLEGGSDKSSGEHVSTEGGEGDQAIKGFSIIGSGGGGSASSKFPGDRSQAWRPGCLRKRQGRCLRCWQNTRILV